MPSAIACPTTTFCVVVDQEGNAYVFHGSGWSPPEQITSDTGLTGPGDLQDVSCASAAWCVAVGYQNSTFVYSSGKWSEGPNYPGQGEMASISCPIVDFCAAVDGFDGAMTFDGSSWSGYTQPLGGANIASFVAVSCTGSDFCAALGVTTTNPETSLYRSGTWGPPVIIGPNPYPDSVVGSGNYPSSVSCATPTFCVAVDWLGQAFAFDGSSWSAHTVDENSLNTVSCPSSGLCVAGDGNGDELTLTGGAWSAPAQVDSNGQIGEISCPSVQLCFALDPDGEVVVSK
jgi:hypothetical protein